MLVAKTWCLCMRHRHVLLCDFRLITSASRLLGLFVCQSCVGNGLLYLDLMHIRATVGINVTLCVIYFPSWVFIPACEEALIQYSRSYYHQPFELIPSANTPSFCCLQTTRVLLRPPTALVPWRVHVVLRTSCRVSSLSFLPFILQFVFLRFFRFLFPFLFPLAQFWERPNY